MKWLSAILIFVTCGLYGQKNIAYHSLEVSYIALNTADLITTYQLIEAGGYEANPLQAKVIHNKPLAIGIKTISTGLILGSCRIIRRDRPKVAFISLLALNIGYAFIVTHNYQLTIKLKM